MEMGCPENLAGRRICNTSIVLVVVALPIKREERFVVDINKGD